MRTRRRAMRRLAAFCARVRVRPRGFFVGMLTWTSGSVHARHPRSWSNRLPAGQGEGTPSALRVAWTLPAWVSLSKRIVRAASTSRTFFTVWHLFFPLSQRVCAVGSWGRTMGRSVPSWPQGGQRVPV
jgi:hypothetical protein